MEFVWWLHWARNYTHIGLWVAIVPNHLVGSCHKSIGIVLATSLIVLTVHWSVGGRQY
jgi:hypothetical protein